MASSWKVLQPQGVRRAKNRAGGENAQKAFTCQPGEGRTLAGLDVQAAGMKRKLCIALSVAWAALLGGGMFASWLCWEPPCSKRVGLSEGTLAPGQCARPSLRGD